MKAFLQSLREITRYPSALVGLLMILGLVALAIYAVVSIPYSEATRMWRGGEDVWYQNPKTAQPVWVNWFRKDKLPDTIFISTKDGSIPKTTVELGEEGVGYIDTEFTFDYPYDEFPQELSIYFTSKYVDKQPYASLTWITPDGREIRVGDFAVARTYVYRVSQDAKLERRLGGLIPEKGLFADLGSETPRVLPGTYTLKVSGVTFEAGTDMDVELVIFGQVHGWAGTDHLRRDLSIALLWGTPVALAFGLLAALGTTVLTMIIAAIGTWFGGWVDELIQRITEVNLVLPFLPILIMVGTFYSRSIWTILGVTILLSIFGGAIKTYRAIFLQIKESPYIEAAQAYGANNWRIIMRYLVPRIIPLLIPQLVVLIPSFVFLEAALAVLGLGDPVLPTWGKVIDDARANGALYVGQYYWVLEPTVLLTFTGLAFAMVGYSLDRIFNPRLRGL